MAVIDKYRRKYAFGEDFGTSQYKFGPVAEEPEIVENRGFIIKEDSIMYKIVGLTKKIIVGPDVALHLGSRDDMSKYLVYPMRDGIVEKNDKVAWDIISEITKYGLLKYRPVGKTDFRGFYVTSALTAGAPKYMYEKVLDIHEKIDEEHGLVMAATIIPQPLAVAIAQKTITCIVVESGHGNTQITPISRYPIRGAIISLNRGGAEADAITGEILKDTGYGDLVPEEKLVRQLKEEIGLVPLEIQSSIKKAKEDEERFHAVYKVPGTTTVIDLGENSWMRFLIGEIAFDPENEVFESYYKRGMPTPRDTVIGEDRLRGTVSFSEAIMRSAGKTPLELQPYLYKKIILSGGNFAWEVPSGMDDVACDSATKIRQQLSKQGVEVNVVSTADPLYSVWKGTIVYSIAVPDDYLWSWDRLEGWCKWR